MVAYNRCLQITFILVQVLFIALGGVMVGVGVWLELEEQSFEAAIDNTELFYGPYLIIAAGCAIVVVAILGIVGAVYDSKINRFLLYFYIVLVLIVFVAQATGGILGFVYRERVFDEVREGLNETLSDYGDNSTRRTRSITRAWDNVQEQLECCGINGTEDWLNTPNPHIDGIPSSCCDSGNCTLTNSFEEGCEDALTEFLEDNLLLIAAIGISFVVGEAIVVLMAVCLVCCSATED